MKIYTEEQLQEAYNRGHMDGKLNNTDYSITDGFKPIELPSDDEIEKEASTFVDLLAPFQLVLFLLFLYYILRIFVLIIKPKKS